MKINKLPETSYKMVRGPDGTIWVSLQPLGNEVNAILEKAKTIDTTSLDAKERQGIDVTVFSLEAVYSFLKALQTEQELREAIKNETH